MWVCPCVSREGFPTWESLPSHFCAWKPYRVEVQPALSSRFRVRQAHGLLSIFHFNNHAVRCCCQDCHFYRVALCRGTVPCTQNICGWAGIGVRVVSSVSWAQGCLASRNVLSALSWKTKLARSSLVSLARASDTVMTSFFQPSNHVHPLKRERETLRREPPKYLYWSFHQVPKKFKSTEGRNSCSRKKRETKQYMHGLWVAFPFSRYLPRQKDPVTHLQGKIHYYLQRSGFYFQA